MLKKKILSFQSEQTDDPIDSIQEPIDDQIYYARDDSTNQSNWSGVVLECVYFGSLCLGSLILIVGGIVAAKTGGERVL